MSTELNPVDFTEIALKSKLKSHLNDKFNPASVRFKMEAKALNKSKDESIPDDESDDRVKEDGAAGFGKDDIEDEMHGVKKNP